VQIVALAFKRKRSITIDPIVDGYLQRDEMFPSLLALISRELMKKYNKKT